jgi:hypothetical protein
MELAERYACRSSPSSTSRAPSPAPSGRARHRRGDRQVDRPDDPAAHPDRRGHHRRGRLGRGAGDRRRRHRHRPREFDLLGHQPRGLRLDPVAVRRAQPPGRHGDEGDRRRAAGARHRRRRHPRAGRRGPHRPRRDGPPDQGPWSWSGSISWVGCRSTSWSRLASGSSGSWARSVSPSVRRPRRSTSRITDRLRGLLSNMPRCANAAGHPARRTARSRGGLADAVRSKRRDQRSLASTRRGGRYRPAHRARPRRDLPPRRRSPAGADRQAGEQRPG